jgi:hypothetical protein
VGSVVPLSVAAVVESVVASDVVLEDVDGDVALSIVVGPLADEVETVASEVDVVLPSESLPAAGGTSIAEPQAVTASALAASNRPYHIRLPG